MTRNELRMEWDLPPLAGYDDEMEDPRVDIGVRERRIDNICSDIAREEGNAYIRNNEEAPDWPCYPHDNPRIRAMAAKRYDETH